jgi:hypothetical protein
MDMIIGRGSQRDPAALNLYTTANRTRIENERPDQEICVEGLQAGHRHVLTVSPTARCRSLTSMYNCVGMVFASRRTSVATEHLEVILSDDGYRPVSQEKAMEGDVVVYRRNNVPQHVGIIYQLEKSLHSGQVINTWVLSTWGHLGEYIHRIAEVPNAYGDAREFWSERRPA